MTIPSPWRCTILKTVMTRCQRRPSQSHSCFRLLLLDMMDLRVAWGCLRSSGVDDEDDGGGGGGDGEGVAAGMDGMVMMMTL